MGFGDTHWLAERMMLLIPLLLSLGVHEWAHAWSAHLLGDDTAKRLGRLSLNPFVHVDPVGTFILPLLGVPFGWAKPVPFNPLRFNRRVGMSAGTMLTAVAGPVSNVALAAICLLVLALGVKVFGLSSPALHALLTNLIFINLILAVFNMIPVPPLDGSYVANALMPECLRPLWDQLYKLGPVGMVIIVLGLQLGGLNIFGWAVDFASFCVKAATT